MFNPARNLWSLLTALLLLSVFRPSADAQQALTVGPKVSEVLNSPPEEIKPDDPPLVRLKKERFNDALNEAKERFDLYKRGIRKLPDLIEVGQRLFSAEADLYDKPEERAPVLLRQLEVYTEAESNLEKQVKEGFANQADLDRLLYYKVSLEIDILNIKSELSHAEPTPH